MERLTERDEHGDIYVKEHDYIQAGKRLAEYEDTDLTPEEIIQLDKQNEEIQNSNIEYYNLAKDCESQVKRIKEENARLKELLKATAEDAKGLFKACDKEYYNHDEYSVPENCKFCINYTQNGCDENYNCKWRYADKVKEVLNDEKIK